MPILAYGGIVPLSSVPHARGLVVYHRVTTSVQAGSKKKGWPKLRAAAWDVHRQIDSAYPGRIVGEPFYDVGSGRVTTHKPNLVEASIFAKENDLTLVASELSRLLRADDYDEHDNFHATPKPEEYQALRKVLNCCRVATVVPPWVTDSERRSAAIKRSPNNGRPSPFMQIGGSLFTFLGPRRDTKSYEAAALKFGVSVPTIRRWMGATVDPNLIGGEVGIKWGKLGNPITVFERMLRTIDQRNA